MNDINVKSVLDYFRQMAECPERPSLDTVLDGLAKICDLDHAGLSAMEGANAVSEFDSLPWQSDAELRERIRNSQSAEIHADQGHAWLITRIGGEALVAWARRSGARHFSETDRWTWLFAGAALARWCSLDALAPLQRRLEESAVVTGRLTHDFGNYLTGILGFTELSVSQVAADSLLYRYLQEVLQGARHGADWVRRLHQFCRRGSTATWPTMLSNVLAGEEARLRAADVQGMRWQTDVPGDLPLLGMDDDAVRTVLAELVNNACQACNGQGTLTFTARVRELVAADCRELLGPVQPGNHVELVVADDGPGIAADIKIKLFHELFFSTKPRHRGLGLLVVYGILHRFRGGLRLAPAENQGTAVHVYIPAAALEGPTLAPGDAPHVLLVHADAMLVEIMRRILEARGYRVSVAASASAILTIYGASRSDFSIVVMDVAKPPQSGFDLARRILDRDADANFLFLHTQTAFHGHREEELLQRFPLLRWPQTPQSFLSAIAAALAPKID